ncbi:hypothetical protein CBS101457_003184 [Exobasidium rhododendri]|nr:hypothetical protein CBS101457_003184 [Exobasidium rhododendri]
MESSAFLPPQGAPVATETETPPSLPALPPRPIKKSDSLSLLADPLQELCPSLHSIQSLCQLPLSSLPDAKEGFRKRRLEKAILRAASNGDSELLSWVCYIKSKVGTENRCVEMTALEGLDWDNIRDDEGTGPLNLAASSGHAEIVQMLVRNGADVDERDALGWTPLMWATNCSNLPLVSFLLSHGANIEAKSFKGATCEDFILSSTSGRQSSSHTSDLFVPGRSSSSPTSKRPLSPHSSDRQLISDLVFEHQQVIWHEKEFKSNSRNCQRLRSLSSSSSSHNSAADSQAPSSLAALPASTRQSSVTNSSPSKSLHKKNSSLTLRRLIGRTERTQIAEAELRARELAEGRKRALLDVAVMMQVDYSDLLGEPPTTGLGDEAEGIAERRARRRKVRPDSGKPFRSDLASGCGAVEVGGDPLSMEFDFDNVRPDQMLVLGANEVIPLLHRIISDATPIRAPWVVRSKPANILFLCVRYACSLPDEDLLEELVFGAVDAIEVNLYAHPTEMTFLAYWLYNGMLLLHYLQRDKTLSSSSAMQDYQSLLAELINEVFVFVIRDIERRIDKVLDAAILQHNPIPDFDDVRFEGEWSFMKTLTGSVKRASMSAHASPSSKRPLSQYFATEAAATATTTSSSSPKLPSTPLSRKNNERPNSTATPTRSMMAELRESSHDASASDLLAKPVPRTITLLLTSTLHILQLYEVNPSIIVQALSQVFYWVGCELFNRVISQRRYLCKSKAMQIRLNISALEDWVKTNALPLSIVNQHLSKLNQLISWLLCQSSLTEFDGMIATMQGLKALNPTQLKKVVKDYRYEVGESRIHPDCLAYLDQLQVDWDNRIEQERIESCKEENRDRFGHARHGTATQTYPGGRQGTAEGQEEEGEETLDDADHLSPDDTMDDTGMPPIQDARQKQKDDVRARTTQRAIDQLFETGQSMTSYTPPATTSSSAGEGQNVLLNSRDMLPFALPSQTHALIVSPGDAFGFGRGHFMGTGTPSLKSVRTESLLGLSSLPSSPALRSAASSESSSIASSARLSTTSSMNSGGGNSVPNTTINRLYPQGKGLTAGSYWQPVPLLPEDTLEEIQALMRKVEEEIFINGINNSRKTSTSVDTNLSEAAVASPSISTALLKRSPYFSTTSSFHAPSLARQYSAQSSTTSSSSSPPPPHNTLLPSPSFE